MAVEVKKQVVEEILTRLKATNQFKKQFKNIKENFASIINASAIGICLLNTKAEITFVNKKFCRIFKSEYKNFVGKKIYEAICIDESCISKINPILKSMLQKKIAEHKMEILSKDSENKKLFLEVMIAPYTEGQYTAGFQLLVNDITDKKELELENL